VSPANNSFIFNKKDWCPGWESNSVAPLNPRKLLTLRGATFATTAKFARVGYSLGTLCTILVLLLFAVIASPQEQSRTFTVPFHSVRGMILLDGIANGHPVSLLFDTGANNTILSPQAAGLDAVQLRALQATNAGTGAEGDYIAREADLRLAERDWISQRVLVMDLGDVNKRMGTRVDGILGEDILQTFSAVRIDFRTKTVDLEQ
jgi:hypothetical protein